ncbi:MAG: hypothetical protein ACK52P_21175, partial [Alphaproteobacteria bacterium]
MTEASHEKEGGTRRMGTVEVYAKHFVAEWNRQQSEAAAQLAVKRAELDRLKQQLSKLVDALADGAPVHT